MPKIKPAAVVAALWAPRRTGESSGLRAYVPLPQGHEYVQSCCIDLMARGLSSDDIEYPWPTPLH